MRAMVKNPHIKPSSPLIQISHITTITKSTQKEAGPWLLLEGSRSLPNSRPMQLEPKWAHPQYHEGPLLKMVLYAKALCLGSDLATTPSLRVQISKYVVILMPTIEKPQIPHIWVLGALLVFRAKPHLQHRLGSVWIAWLWGPTWTLMGLSDYLCRRLIALLLVGVAYVRPARETKSRVRSQVIVVRQPPDPQSRGALTASIKHH